MAVQYFEVGMSGSGDYRFRVAYEVIPQSGGALVAVTSQWMRRSGSSFGSFNNAAPYSLTIGGYATKSGTRAFDGSLNGWQWIESTSQLFVTGSSTSITATFDTQTATAGAGSIVSLTVPLAVASQATFSPSSSLTAGSAVTINTNRQNPAYTHSIYWGFGSLSAQLIGETVGASASWTPPLSMLTQIPNATSGSGVIGTNTFNGSTGIGYTTTPFTLTAPPSVVPTCSGVVAADQNSTVASIVGRPVQGLSRLKLTVNGAGIYGSTITTRQATMLGQTVNSGDEIAVTTAGNIPVTGRVTDSRGRVGTWSGTVTALAYAPPAVSAYQARRCNASGVLDDDGAYLRIDLNASVSSLMNSTERNAMTVQVRTRPHGGSVWTPRNTINTGLTYNTYVVVSGGGIFTTTSSWDVRVEVADKFSTVIADTTVTTAAVALDLNGTKVGIGKIHEQGALDVAEGGIYDDGHRVINTSNVATNVTDGIIRLASAATVNTGTNTTQAVTPSTLRNAAYRPWAMAQGVTTTPATGYQTVTFPAGRFTQPPIVVASNGLQANVGLHRIINVTTTSFQIGIWGLGGTQIAGTGVHWIATQATSANASG